MTKGNKWRKLDGILLFNKPSGLTSNNALQNVKRLFQAEKAGHTGTLDPLASGLLPICFGEATKFARFLLTQDKTYLVKAKLGARTTTSDCQGEVVRIREVPPLSLGQIDQVAATFRGETDQVPSMYSALKHQGQPLYKYARQGIEVTRAARKIQVHQLKLIKLQQSELEFSIHCSKGTYVRTLVDDLGESLGCGAHVTYLHRTQVGRFKAEAMHTWQKLNTLENQLCQLDNLLLPTSDTVSELYPLTLTNKMTVALQYGQKIKAPPEMTARTVALFDETHRFIGVGEVLPEGSLQPKRLIKHPR